MIKKKPPHFKDKHSPYTRQKKQMYRIILTLAIPVMSFFGIYNFMRTNFIELLIDILILILFAGCLFGLKKGYDTLVYRTSISLIALAVLINIASGTGGIATLFWMFILPPIAFFFLGRKTGFLVIAFSTLIFGGLILGPDFLNTHGYDSHTSLRFFSTYFFVVILSLAFETARIHYERDLEHHHSRIKEQKDFLETLMKTLPSPVFFKDTQGIYQGCNPAFEKMTCRPKDEIIGKTVYAIAPREIADEYLRQDTLLFNSPGRQTYEWKIKPSDDKPLQVIFNKSTYADKDGNIQGLIGVITDITELKQKERILKENELRFRALFEEAKDAIYLFDGAGNFLNVNQAACDTSGYTRDELMGLSVAQLDRDFTQNSVQQLLGPIQPGQTLQVNGTHVKKDGTCFPVEVGVSCFTQDNAIVYLGHARDISERRKSEAEKEKLIQELGTAIREIKTLNGMLPICSSCKKIRDDQGYWNRIETYIEKNSDALFSHSICPECSEKLYGEESWFKKMKARKE